MAVSAHISWNRHPRRTVQVTESPFKVIPAARSGRRDARGIFRPRHRTLRAARVGYYPGFRPGLRRVRPSRASPARLCAAPARLCRAYAIPRAPRLAWPVLRPPFGRARATPAATWSAMSTGLDAATRFPSSPLRGSPDPRC